MAIRPILIDKRSPFLGEACALCKEPFAPGQDIIICPEDATRHHVHCWRMNNNHCSAYGCGGQGRPILRTPYVEEEDGEVLEAEVLDAEVVQPDDGPDSKVRTLPSGGISCAQSCLILAIALSIVLFAVSCFGLWAMLDYILIEILDWQYRGPLSALQAVEVALHHVAPLATYLLV
jgi:hypothetical protein